MSAPPPPRKTAAEMLAAAKAKLAAAKTRKSNNGSARAANSRNASPNRSVSARSSSAARSRSLAAQIAHSEALSKKLREKEMGAAAASMSNLEALAAKPAKRAVSNEVTSLERKVESLERSHAAKVAAVKNYEEERAPSRNRRMSVATSLTNAARWARPGVRTSVAVKANKAVEEINKEVKRLQREADHEAIVLRDTRKKLDGARKRLATGLASAASSRASSRSGSPTGSVRSTASRRLTANNHNARLANLRRRMTAKQARNAAAAAKKENAAAKKLADAYKKLEGFDDDVLDAFCEELRQRRRGASGAAAAARAVVAASISNSNSNNNSNMR